jgi:hypothetical protein
MPSTVGVSLEEPEFCVKELTVGHRNKMIKISNTKFQIPDNHNNLQVKINEDFYLYVV